MSTILLFVQVFIVGIVLGVDGVMWWLFFFHSAVCWFYGSIDTEQIMLAKGK